LKSPKEKGKKKRKNGSAVIPFVLAAKKGILVVRKVVANRKDGVCK
jgi:hypothetical protein